jgi:tetratricopeptide (TPR) repeat protein
MERGASVNPMLWGQYSLRSVFLACALSLGGCASAAVTNGGGTTPGADPLTEVSPEQLYAQGEQLARTGEALRAEEYLSAALQRGYPAEQVLPLLLKVCLAASRLGAALNYAQPYLQLHPEDYHLRYLVAAVLFGQSRPAEAQRELTRVLQQKPDFAHAHYLLAVILRDHAQDIPGATQHFRMHQQLDPRGLHGAEVAAWLAENAHEAEAPAEQTP